MIEGERGRQSLLHKAGGDASEVASQEDEEGHVDKPWKKEGGGE